MCGLHENGAIAFRVPLPARGHAVLFHPTRPIGVSFARRPGRFAIVFDVPTGEKLAAFTATPRRHFYGHDVFAPDGMRLFTTENDYATGRGIIGIWSVFPFRRLGEFSSGGVGPHDIALLPDQKTLVIANGGLNTHPNTGRQPLNLHTMNSNLAYLNLQGEVLETLQLAPELQLNSIRHLAVNQQGLVGFAMQWQGSKFSEQPLVGLHARGHAPVLLVAPPSQQHQLAGYVGSIAFARDGKHLAYTSPRGGVAHIFDALAQKLAKPLLLPDVCGVAPSNDGFSFTAGTGQLLTVNSADGHTVVSHELAWDNHIVGIDVA